MNLKNSLLASGVAMSLMTASYATVEAQLYADTYLVQDGSKTYSVLDIYVKGTHNADSVGCTVLGLSSHSVIFKTSLGTATSDIFEHGGSAGNGWLPTDSAAKSWDSFLAAGNRAQGTKAKVTNRATTLIDHGVAGNWTAASGFSQMGIAGSNFIDAGTASGWYSSKGGNCYSAAGASENPYARVSLYNSFWATTYPDLYRGDEVMKTKGKMQTGRTAATGAPVLNGAAGAPLDNCWMVGRFAIEVTNRSGDPITMQAQFNLVGKNGSGTNNETGTTYSGALTTGTNPTYKVNKFFTFEGMPSTGGCTSDIDATGTVDLGDIGLLLMEFGPCAAPCAYDLDGTGVVDLGDIALALQDFGPCSG